ncbi:MAG: glycosyltransferase [bacterium]|nr:glycosyltransferase [bacterium]
MSINQKSTPPISVIITTFNEANTISALLQALEKQTLLPAEVIIVDANSTDGTIELVTTFAKKSALTIQLLPKRGNRSVGRNLAIKSAKHSLIAITDAGCIPEKTWLQTLVGQHQKSKAPVVAGYYKGIAQTPFEEAVIPYALVMPDKVNEAHFLPATRSMLLTKKFWEQLGGFNEELSDNEDYDFARRLQEKNIPMTFTKNAVVSWQPRSNLRDFFNMLYRFARGDAAAGLFRPKVAFLFARYILLLVVSLAIAVVLEPKFVLKLWIPLGVLYSLWAVDKNVRYTPRGWLWLPTLQFTADAAVMSGTIAGLLKRLQKTIFG